MARTLDAKGLNVIAGCLTESGRTGLKAVTSARLKTVHIDVTNKESINAAYEFTLNNIGNEFKRIKTTSKYLVIKKIQKNVKFEYIVQESNARLEVK